MTAAAIETDYLIVGTGAGGMAFADALLAASDASIALVDERPRPGGHWNDAYPFVRLHQPSSFYGVNALTLGRGDIDREGHNAGFHELASGAEVCAYFAKVMDEVLLPSGRVRYFPESRFDSERGVVSSGDGVRPVRARKIVDAAYAAGAIPARHTPSYAIAPGVRHIPVNGLAEFDARAERYVVIGAGKTGMDACVWLLDRGVDPGAITWIAPQDAWLYNRAYFQPGDAFLDQLMGGMALQMEASAAAQSLDEVYARLEAVGVMLRIDPAVKPTAFRCAIVSESELNQLRRIGNIVRKGRVQAIEPGRIVLERGELTTDAGVVHVDCSAKGVAPRPAKPIFDGDRITLQFVRLCQPAFSSALTGFVEGRYGDDEAKKNALSTVVPSPERCADWVPMTLAHVANMLAWMGEPALMEWLGVVRLNGSSALLRPSSRLTPAQDAIRERLRAATPAAMANLPKLLV